MISSSARAESVEPFAKRGRFCRVAPAAIDGSRFLALPDEILVAILGLLPGAALVSILLTCRLLGVLSAELLDRRFIRVLSSLTSHEVRVAAIPFRALTIGTPVATPFFFRPVTRSRADRVQRPLPWLGPSQPLTRCTCSIARCCLRSS